MIKKTTTITCDVCGADCSVKETCRPNMVQVYHLDIGISGTTLEGKAVPRGDERFAVDLCPKCYDGWMLLNHNGPYRKPTQFVYYLKKDPTERSWWNRRKD